MSTKWAVTVAAERVALDEQRQGDATFTVTNSGAAADRAVFDVVPGEGADASWFSVADPQRLVRGGASAAYLMKVAVPADTPPGTYAVQGLVYSADSAPEESSVLSPRIMLTVADAAEPDQRRWPWWWAVVAGLVVVVLLVVGWLVFSGDGGEEAEPAPVPTPQAGEVVMPELLGMTEQEALATLSDIELTVRPIRYRHDPEQANTVVQQSFEAGEVVSQAWLVDLVVAVELTAPVVTEPDVLPVLPAGEPAPTLAWNPGRRSPAREWQVTMYLEECRLDYLDPASSLAQAYCEFPEEGTVSIVDTLSFTPELTLQPEVVPLRRVYHSGWVRWQVQAVDDFDNPGPASEAEVFRIGVVQP